MSTKGTIVTPCLNLVKGCCHSQYELLLIHIQIFQANRALGKGKCKLSTWERPLRLPLLLLTRMSLRKIHRWVNPMVRTSLWPNDGKSLIMCLNWKIKINQNLDCWLNQYDTNKIPWRSELNTTLSLDLANTIIIVWVDFYFHSFSLSSNEKCYKLKHSNRKENHGVIWWKFQAPYMSLNVKNSRRSDFTFFQGDISLWILLRKSYWTYPEQSKLEQWVET